MLTPRRRHSLPSGRMLIMPTHYRRLQRAGPTALLAPSLLTHYMPVFDHGITNLPTHIQALHAKILLCLGSLHVVRLIGRRLQVSELFI